LYHIIAEISKNSFKRLNFVFNCIAAGSYIYYLFKFNIAVKDDLATKTNTPHPSQFFLHAAILYLLIRK